MIFGQYNAHDSNYHYTVNLVNNLHFANPLLPPIAPATQLDFSYLTLTNLRDKEANYIPSELHLNGSCGESRDVAPTELELDGYDVGGCEEGGANGFATNTDTMDLDSGIDIDIYAASSGYGGVDHGDADDGGAADEAVTSVQTGADLATNAPVVRQPRTVLLPIQGLGAGFRWDTFMDGVRASAAEMKHDRRGRGQVSARAASACTYGVRWRQETHGQFIEDNDDLGAYVVKRVDNSGKVYEEKIAKVGYRRERDGGDHVGANEKTVEELKEEDLASRGELKREFDRQMEMSHPWRHYAEAEKEHPDFRVGPADMVMGMVNSEIEAEAGRYEYTVLEPQIWSVPGRRL